MAIGLIGFGAFGHLIAEYLSPHCELLIHDAVEPEDRRIASLAESAGCARVILAVPVQAIADVTRSIAPHIQPGARVYDVASVKLEPMQAMAEYLPDHCQIVGTHPLFGPQSAASGLAGLPIVLCPSAGVAVDEEVPFLRDTLGLDVHVSDADTHDRAMARVQGLTHLIAKVMTQFDPKDLPYTTRSYDLLSEAARLVSDDSDELFRAIEHLNPYAKEVREEFFASIRDLSNRLDQD